MGAVNFTLQPRSEPLLARMGSGANHGGYLHYSTRRAYTRLVWGRVQTIGVIYTTAHVGPVLGSGGVGCKSYGSFTLQHTSGLLSARMGSGANHRCHLHYSIRWACSWLGWGRVQTIWVIYTTAHVGPIFSSDGVECKPCGSFTLQHTSGLLLARMGSGANHRGHLHYITRRAYSRLGWGRVQTIGVIYTTD